MDVTAGTFIPCIDRVRRVVARARDQEHELPRVKIK